MPKMLREFASRDENVCRRRMGERECLSAVVGGGSHCTIDFWLHVPATSSNSQTIFNLLSLCSCAGKTVLTELVCAFFGAGTK